MTVLNCVLFTIIIQFWSIFAALEPPIVTIADQGMIAGVYLKMFRTQKIIGYLGIPYAAPPVGLRRFNPPVVDDIPKWEGIRNATQLQPDCFQQPRKELKRHEELYMSLLNSFRKHLNETPRTMDEDCLYLNVYVPDGPPPADGWTTIAWLHSGDFQNGSPSDIDPFQLVIKQKVIIVTIAFRLNIFGFFTSIDGEAPGNFGLMDQSAALLWIRHNIKEFGGNDKSITLLGHGSGALSIGFHLTSGIWTHESFHKAIIMSGSAMFEGAVREARSYSGALDETATAFGCYRRPTSLLLECLRNLAPHLLSEIGPVRNWGPVIDAGLSNSTMPFISDYPRILVERGKFRNVSLMIGYTDMEEALDISLGFLMDDGIGDEMYQTLIEDVVLNDLAQLEMNDTCGGNNKIVLDALNFVYKPYPPITDTSLLRRKYIDFETERKFIAPSFFLAEHMSKMNDVYAYRFDIKPKTPEAIDGLPDWVTVPHRFDLIFVWGFPYWSKISNEEIPLWDNMDKRVSEIIMTLWANFAKFTNPSQVGVYINWDQFTAHNQNVLIIDRTFNMSDTSSIHYPGIQFWNSYYDDVAMFAMQCCNATNGVGNTHIFTANLFKTMYFDVNFLSFLQVRLEIVAILIVLSVCHILFYDLNLSTSYWTTTKTKLSVTTTT